MGVKRLAADAQSFGHSRKSDHFETTSFVQHGQRSLGYLF